MVNDQPQDHWSNHLLKVCAETPALYSIGCMRMCRRTTHSDEESSSEEREPLSPLQPPHRTSSSDSRFTCDYSQGGPGSHTGSLGRISASSSRQDPTPGWGDPRVLPRLHHTPPPIPLAAAQGLQQGGLGSQS